MLWLIALFFAWPDKAGDSQYLSLAAISVRVDVATLGPRATEWFRINFY